MGRPSVCLTLDYLKLSWISNSWYGSTTMLQWGTVLYWKQNKNRWKKKKNRCLLFIIASQPKAGRGQNAGAIGQRLCFISCLHSMKVTYQLIRSLNKVRRMQSRYQLLLRRSLWLYSDVKKTLSRFQNKGASCLHILKNCTFIFIVFVRSPTVKVIFFDK